MRCERAHELFSDYHEGSVQRALLVPFESHLKECDSCRAEMESFGHVWKLLDSAPVIEPPADFRAAVWKRIDAQEAARKQTAFRPRFAFDWRSLFSRPALAWAAALLVIVLLAGVVVPGRYTAARMMFPWNLFYSGQTQQAVIGAPSIVTRSDGRFLVLPVNNSGRDAVHIEAAFPSGPVVRQGDSFDVPADTKRPVYLTPLKPDAGSEPVRLILTWTQNGQTQSKDFTIPILTR